MKTKNYRPACDDSIPPSSFKISSCVAPSLIRCLTHASESFTIRGLAFVKEVRELLIEMVSFSMACNLNAMKTKRDTSTKSAAKFARAMFNTRAAVIRKNLREFRSNLRGEPFRREIAFARNVLKHVDQMLRPEFQGRCMPVAGLL